MKLLRYVPQTSCNASVVDFCAPRGKRIEMQYAAGSKDPSRFHTLRKAETTGTMDTRPSIGLTQSVLLDDKTSKSSLQYRSSPNALRNMRRRSIGEKRHIRSICTVPEELGQNEFSNDLGLVRQVERAVVPGLLRDCDFQRPLCGWGI